MHKIYFEKRCIIICTPDDEALADPNSVEFHVGDRVDVHALVRMFEVQDTLSRIYIPSDDTEQAYRRICAEFKEVNAAGGLVSNRRGITFSSPGWASGTFPRAIRSPARTSR